MTKTYTNKADAARRQLDVCIRMFFNREDPLAIHTIVSASHRILLDLAERSGKSKIHETIKQMIRPRKENEFWTAINKMANYLKHADRDPDKLLHDLTEEVNDLTICGACIYYASLGYQVTLEMRVFMIWFLAINPDLVADVAPFKAQFTGASLEPLRRQSRNDQVEFGRELLATTRAQEFRN